MREGVKYQRTSPCPLPPTGLSLQLPASRVKEVLSWKQLFTTWNLTFVVAMETSSWGHSLCFAEKRHFDMISGEGAPSTHLSTPFLPPHPTQPRVRCGACPWYGEPWLALLNLPATGERTPQRHTPTAGEMPTAGPWYDACKTAPAVEVPAPRHESGSSIWLWQQEEVGLPRVRSRHWLLFTP